MKIFATKLGKLLAAAAAFILLSTATVLLLSPVILKRVAVPVLTKFLGRTVSIQKIDFNLRDISVTIRGLQLDEPKGGVLLSWDSLYARLDPRSSLADHIWVFKEAVLREPHLNIARNADRTLSFADLLLLDWPKMPQLRLNLMRLVDGTVFFRDAALPSRFSTTLSHITATANDFSTSADHNNSFSVSAVSERGEKFSSSGFFRLDPLSSRGELAAEDVRINKYYPYFEKPFNVTIADGTLTARASYEVDLARDRLKVLLEHGTIAVHSLKVYERGSNAPMFGFEELAIHGANVDLLHQKIDVASIAITGGSAVLSRLPDNSFNVQHLVKPMLTPSMTTAATSANWNFAAGEIRLADFAAEVNHVFGRETVGWKELVLSKPTFQMRPLTASFAAVTLSEGNLVFTDASSEPPVTMALNHLDVRMGGFSSVDPRLANVAVHANINDAAQLQISGETNLTHVEGETNVRGLIQNVNLTPLSPYAARYLGYELTAGELSLDVAFSIQSRKLNAKSKIEIDRLTLGGKTESKDATNLPVPLGIALLKDSSGRITLNLPIAGTLDDPKFDIQKAIIDAILNPLTKTVTFPFAALGAQMGGGGDELGFQEFASESAELIPQETGKLNTILQGLKRWPEFMLDIEGSVDVKNDTGDLQLLAANRSRIVKAYLVSEGSLEPDRIFLIENSLANVPRKGSRALLYLSDKYRSPN